MARVGARGAQRGLRTVSAEPEEWGRRRGGGRPAPEARARSAFDNRESFNTEHYAFKVSETEFDAIFGRVKEEGLDYGSGPFSPTDMEINHWNGGRGVYFRDPSGHLLELLTQDYTPEMFTDR